MATLTERTPGTLVGTGLLVRLAGAGLLAASLQGCGEAQVAEGHRDLILRLATGASTRDRGIMDRAATDVDRLAADHALTDGEAKAFRSILDAVRDGQWDRAQELAYALRDGQEPTAEDRERLAKRPMREIKKAPVRKQGGPLTRRSASRLAAPLGVTSPAARPRRQREPARIEERAR